MYPDGYQLTIFFHDKFGVTRSEDVENPPFVDHFPEETMGFPQLPSGND